MGVSSGAEPLPGSMSADEVLLESNVPITVSVNPFSWRWYYLPLELGANATAHNAVVMVDSETLVSVAGEETWAVFDVLLLNGTLPGNAQTGEPGPVVSGNPYCWTNEDCPYAYALRYPERPRVTASFGYNHSAPGGQMAPLSRLVVGVREAGGAASAVSFTIRATLLPRVLQDGMVIDSAVAPCVGEDAATCRQYFTVPVQGYDILRIRLERTGDNLTYTDARGAVSNGGRGLVGALLVGTPAMLHTPPPLAYDERREIDNVTAAVELEYFCTLPPQAGTYTVALVPGDQGGFGAELLTSAAEVAIDSGIPRQGRGRFRLRVRHAMFRDGAVDGTGDSRAGCLSYGQSRNYTLTSTGLGDGILHAQISGGNVSALRARCEGCDWVVATPPLSAVSLSSCSMRTGTNWELQLSLADLIPATLAGLQPTEFVLSMHLQNATVTSGDVVLPTAAGGRGYVCCGAVQSFVVPDVPRTHAVAIRLNLTRGHVRAAFLKHGSCAQPTVDVRGAECSGLCEIAWLTVYDEFYGSMEFTTHTTLAVPFGPEAWAYDVARTKRREGDWYVSVQALPGIAAEYQMEVLLLEPPRAPYVFECSRFAGFCPRDHYHGGLGLTLTSGGLRRVDVQTAIGNSWLLALCATLMTARLARWLLPP